MRHESKSVSPHLPAWNYEQERHENENALASLFTSSLSRLCSCSGLCRRRLLISESAWVLTYGRGSAARFSSICRTEKKYFFSQSSKYQASNCSSSMLRFVKGWSRKYLV